VVRPERPPVDPIFVAPSHGHDDHTSQMRDFAGKHSVAVVPLSLAAAQTAFGIRQWPTDIGANRSWRDRATST
jgi:hypothetical protein